MTIKPLIIFILSTSLLSCSGGSGGSDDTLPAPTISLTSGGGQLPLSQSIAKPVEIKRNVHFTLTGTDEFKFELVSSQNLVLGSGSVIHKDAKLKVDWKNQEMLASNIGSLPDN